MDKSFIRTKFKTYVNIGTKNIFNKEKKWKNNI